MKRLIFLVVAVALMFGLAGCSEYKLKEPFDAEVMESMAAEVIDCVNAQDYEAVYGMFSAEMKETLSPEYLEETLQPVMEQFPPFTKVNKYAVASEYDEETEQDMGVIMAACSYGRKKVRFNLSFNTDMELIGLYVK